MKLQIISEAALTTVTKITAKDLAYELIDYCQTEALMRYSNYPGVGIDPVRQTGNNWVSGIFFTTFKYFKPNVKRLYDNVLEIISGVKPYKYIIIANINSSKVMDRKDYSEREFVDQASKIMDLAREIQEESPQLAGHAGWKEALRQAHLRSGIEVVIGGHDKYEVTVFDDDAVKIIKIYEVVAE